jgi:bacillithiol biosynthesis cysteine-adding enzyme BshC
MFAAQHIPYNQTASFTRIVNDYLNSATTLKPFYSQAPTIEGIKTKIEERKSFATNRSVLVEVLKGQYKGLAVSSLVEQNINNLLSANTFTVCTAHQPNLFTGPLYFIYKILHAIKLAEHLKQNLPQYNFVPVYYMGSEDADFAELNHTYVDGKKLEWKKEQGGAVGRMTVDKTLIQLIDELEGQLIVEEKGREIIDLLRRAYINGKTIQWATFELLNDLYGAYGLVVLIPDHSLLKKQAHKIFEDDLFNNTSSKIVQETSERLSKHYDAQAYPREINLFYLKDAIRERIEKKEDRFFVLNTEISFTEEELRKELETYPERFSPNVILRGIYQETILPNLAFIGGGGELAYWLQLKDLFANYNVPYPVLVLRNSFLVVEEKWKGKIQQLRLSVSDFFQSENRLMNQIVEMNAAHPVLLNGSVEKATTLFEQIKEQALQVDATLSRHVYAIQAKSLKALHGLEKKMLRAEKRKFSDHQVQIEKIKAALFPNNGLQERVENFSRFYAKWGRSFIEELHKHSLSLEQEFTVLVEQPTS